MGQIFSWQESFEPDLRPLSSNFVPLKKKTQSILTDLGVLHTTAEIARVGCSFLWKCLLTGKQEGTEA